MSAENASLKRIKVKLTEAQQSALECGDIETDKPLLLSCWIWDRLEFEPRVAAKLLEEITDLANSEDAQAEHNTDPECCKLARRACNALTSLAGKVARAARKHEETNR